MPGQSTHFTLQVESAQSLSPLSRLERLSDGAALAQRILEKMGRARLLEALQDQDVKLLASFMPVYRADEGAIIIREGDVDDFMLLVIEGKIQVIKHDQHGLARPMTVAGPGMSLGEMSMIDGEPRFATCVAAQNTLFAVMTRDAIVRLLVEYPSLGSKLLIKLVTLLSQRLRQTSTTLLHYMQR